jgi:hypothetical protein
MHGGVWEPIIFLFHIHEMIKHGPIDYLQKGAARPNKKSSTYFKFLFYFFFLVWHPLTKSVIWCSVIAS